MGVEPTGWNILGTLFRCRETPSDVGAELALLLSGFKYSRRLPVQRTVNFAILRRKGTTELDIHRQDGTSPSPIRLRAPVGAWAEYHLVSTALALARDRWALHAAAVVAPGGTCVILGRKDDGKTTLAMLLWAHGMTVLADDVLPIAYMSRSPDPFPRAFHTDHPLIAPLRGRIPARPVGYPRSYYPFPGVATREIPPVRFVLVLRRGGRARGEATPLQQCELAHHLVRGSIRTQGFDFGRVHESARLLSEGCSAYTIRASTQEGAAERAIGILTGASSNGGPARLRALLEGEVTR